MNKNLHWGLLGVLLFAVALGACGDDDDPTGPGADTTAPIVLSIDPSLDDTGVELDEDIVVRFNEDMDETSATGQVTLSNGTVLALSWDDARTLRIDHSDWAEGIRVTVTLGVGITDLAGNGLATAYSSGFWTQSTTLTLLATNPAKGATGVVRNTTVAMLFSQRMNLSTLSAATTVDDGTIQRAPVEFVLNSGSDDWVIMSFPTILPALETITVSISTAATSLQGTPLAVAESFEFTTGSTSDTTPPTLVSIVPANGSIIAASTSSLVMTFSEAIDPDEFRPTRIGAQFALMLEYAQADINWSAGGTVLTVPLPTPLPAGLAIEVEFATFYDLAGNASTSPLEYRVDVAGTPDPFPYVDGVVLDYFNRSGEVGGFIGSSFYSVRVEQETPGGNIFRLARYGDEILTEFDGWERMQRTATQLLFLGFREQDGSSTFDVSLTPPVIYQKLPMLVQSWSGSTVADTPEGDVNITYTVEVLGQEDVPTVEPLLNRRALRFAGGVPQPVSFWIDCWKTVLSYEMESGGETFTAGVDTMWYAPTVGMVRSVSLETDNETETSYQSEDDLIWVRYPAEPEF